MWAGGIQAIKFIALVDIVLGPLLTLILFSPGKKGLLSDMIIITCLQVLCFAFGTWALYDQRPSAFVLGDDGVHLISNHIVSKHALKLPNSEREPQLLFLDLPSDTKTWEAIKISTELVDGIPLAYRDDLYLPIAAVSNQDYATRISAVQTSPEHSEMLKLIDTTLIKTHSNNCDWIPLHSKHVDGAACFSKTDGVIEVSRAKNASSETQ